MMLIERRKGDKTIWEWDLVDGMVSGVAYVEKVVEHPRWREKSNISNVDSNSAVWSW